MYEPLLDNTYVETLMDEDDFEIDTGSRDRLQGIKQEDPTLRDDRKLATRDWKHQGPQGKMRQSDARTNSELLLRQPNYSAIALPRTKQG